MRILNISAGVCSALLAVAPAFAAPNAAHVSMVIRADSKSGRLVRSVVVKPAVLTSDSSSTPAIKAADNIDLTAMIDQIAAEQGVEESLVHSVIRAESNYNPYAVSPKGALGMMQLIPATARRFGVGNAFDIRANVEGGVKYLKFLLEYYKGDYARTIAAYNAGEGAVDKYNGIPPYAETQNYVVQVARNLKTARQKRAAAAPEPPAEPAKMIASKTFNPVTASVGTDGRVYYRTP